MKYNGKEITVEYTEFPDGVHRLIKAFVVEEYNGYLIGIDSRRAQIVQRFALGHELAHIFLGHELMPLSEGFKARQEEKEREANKAAWHYYRAYRDNKL